MKLFMLKTIKNIGMLLTILSLLISVSGGIIMVYPGLLDELLTRFDMSETGMLISTVGMFLMGAGGIIIKNLSSAYNTAVKNSKTLMDIKVDANKKEADARINAVESSMTEVITDSITKLNSVIDENDKIKSILELILEYQALTAQKNLSQNIVKPEIKEALSQFLTKLNETDFVTIPNTYIEIVDPNIKTEALSEDDGLLSIEKVVL